MPENDEKLFDLSTALPAALLALLMPILFQVDEYLDSRYQTLFIVAYFFIFMCFFMQTMAHFIRIIKTKNWSLLSNFILLYAGILCLYSVSIGVIEDYLGNWCLILFFLFIGLTTLPLYLNIKKESKTKSKMQLLFEIFKESRNNSEKIDFLKDFIQYMESNYGVPDNLEYRDIKNDLKKLDELKAQIEKDEANLDLKKKIDSE
jgi:hypothetical protein